MIYPMYILPNGILNSIYQIFRTVEVSGFSIKKEIIIDLEDGCKIQLDFYEPKIQKRKHSVLKILFDIPKVHLFIAGDISMRVSKTVLKLAIFMIDEMSGRRLKLIKRKTNIKKEINIKREINIDNNNQEYDYITDNILLVHGLNGTSKSTYIKGMANIFLDKKCRVFCFNARGVNIPSSSSVFNHIGLTSDIHSVVNHILNNYNGKLSLIGFSMGANWVGKYLGEHPNNERIKMGVGVCCPFNFNKLRFHFYGKSLFCKTMTKFMTSNYKRYIKRSVCKNDLVDKLDQCRNLEEIDSLFLNTVFKCDSLEEFYNNSSCINFIDKITVPTLFLSASDDPLIPVSMIPLNSFRKNSNLSFLIIKGGHLGFFNNGSKTNAEMIVEKFYESLFCES